MRSENMSRSILTTYHQRWSPRGHGLGLEAPRGQPVVSLALALASDAKSFALALASGNLFPSLFWALNPKVQIALRVCYHDVRINYNLFKVIRRLLTYELFYSRYLNHTYSRCCRTLCSWSVMSLRDCAETSIVITGGEDAWVLMETVTQSLTRCVNCLPKNCIHIYDYPSVISLSTGFLCVYIIHIWSSCPVFYHCHRSWCLLSLWSQIRASKLL